MGGRSITRRARSMSRGRARLRAVALAAGCYAASGCMGEPGQGPVDAAPEDAAPEDAALVDAALAAPRFVQVAYIHASNRGPHDFFGTSVAVAGDMILAGAPGEESAASGIGGDQEDDSVWSRGAVYSFQRGDAGWQQEAYIKPTLLDPERPYIREGWFGQTVAMSGDTLAVAAPIDSRQGIDSGAVYVFRRSDAGWQHEAFFNVPDAFMFGAAMALDGDTLAAWQPCGEVYDGPLILRGAGGPWAVAEPECAAIHVFRRSGTTWSEEARIPYPPSAEHRFDPDVYATPMALSGDTLVIGGKWDDSGATDSGAVHVFRRTGTTWQQEAYVKASNAEVDDKFGRSVALAGDTLVVGAFDEDSGATGIDGDQQDNSAPNSGAVYVFRRTGTVWQQEAYVKASHSREGDRFGHSVALSGDTLAVGSRATGLDQPGQGAVLLFHRSDEGWQEDPHAVVSSDSHDENGWFGTIALEGDTLVIGSPSAGPDPMYPDLYQTGAMYVFQRVRD
jgi:hypothetical protein